MTLLEEKKQYFETPYWNCDNFNIKNLYLFILFRYIIYIYIITHKNGKLKISTLINYES